MDMYHVKNDKRSVRSANLIYNALRGLMAQKDFEAITVTELVEQAGVGRATFYRAFDSIDDVLRLKCDQRFEELTRLMRAQRQTFSKAGGIQISPKLFLDFWYQNSEIITLLTQAYRFEYLLAAFVRLFRALFEQDITSLVPERFSEYILAMQTGAVICLLMQWITDEKNIPSDEMADFLENTIVQLEKIHAKNTAG